MPAAPLTQLFAAPAGPERPPPASAAKTGLGPRLGRVLLYLSSFYLLLHLIWFLETADWIAGASFLAGLPILLALAVPALLPEPISRPYLLFSYIFLAPAAFFCAAHLILFQTPLTSQSFFAVLAANPAVSSRPALFPWQFWPAGAAMVFIPAWLLHRALNTACPSFGKSTALAGLALAAPFLAFCLLANPKNAIRANIINDVYVSLLEYHELRRAFQAETPSGGQAGFTAARLTTPPDEERTLVVVIGEAVNRNHLGLYGYQRNTTPGLTAILGELIVFTNIISATTQTGPAVSEALSLPAGGEDRGDNRVPIISLFRQTGFHTYWLSNQADLQNGHTQILRLALATRQQAFLNHGGRQSFYPGLDGSVLPHLEKILRNDPGRKVVFIHLLGSQAEYSRRYPTGAERFTDSRGIADQPWRSPAALKQINAYDNSIAYTDFVLKDIIDLTRRLAPESLVVYFADHGEEVYDALPWHGHAQSLASPHMYEIPLIIWLSEGFRAANPNLALEWLQYAERAGSGRDLPYTLSELAGIRFAEFRPERSLVSPSYRAQPRIILGQDFDAVFPGRQEAAGATPRD